MNELWWVLIVLAVFAVIAVFGGWLLHTMIVRHVSLLRLLGTFLAYVLVMAVFMAWFSALGQS